MKLKNRKTGEIGDLVAYDSDKGIFAVKAQGGDRCYYYSLAALHEVWEDYEETTEYWCIDWMEKDGIYRNRYEDKRDEFNKQIGNYFSSREEAERAVEKLKAFKKLKDKGFRFEGWDNTDRSTIHNFSLFVAIEDLEGITKDLDICFGGEE